jgi:putative zinc finger protein
MTLLTCAAVRRRLQAFYDRELPVREMIDIEAHLADCPPCTRDLRDITFIGDGLRLAAAPGPADDWTGLQPGVISRMRAEAHESWTARVRRALDDMHLVWIGLGATTATCVCALSVLSMLSFASPERNDSLAAVMAVMTTAAPDLGAGRADGRNQASELPEIVYAPLDRGRVEGDGVLSVAAVVTRDGRVSGLKLLTNEPDARSVPFLVDTLSRGRGVEPAQFGGSPIALNLVAELRDRVGRAQFRGSSAAVNLVWLVAHTTVKAKYRS